MLPESGMDGSTATPSRCITSTVGRFTGGLCLVNVVEIPGNILAGNRRLVIFVNSMIVMCFARRC